MVWGLGLKSYDSGPQLQVKMDQGLINDQVKWTCGPGTAAGPRNCKYKCTTRKERSPCTSILVNYCVCVSCWHWCWLYAVKWISCSSYTVSHLKISLRFLIMRQCWRTMAELAWLNHQCTSPYANTYILFVFKIASDSYDTLPVRIAK
jgi:hypothetical protein